MLLHKNTNPDAHLRSALCTSNAFFFCEGRLPGVFGAPRVALEQLLCLLQRAVRLQSPQLHLQYKPISRLLLWLV